MLFLRSHVFWGVFVTAFVVLFCVDLACRADPTEGDVILKLANIGDNIALSCSRPDGVYDNYISWFRKGTLIANWEGVFINDPRFKQGVIDDVHVDSINIYISNITFTDSATFKCLDYYNNTLQSYDLRVIRCSNCTKASHSNPNKVRVICTLNNYWTKQALSRNITLNGNIYRRASFQENTFSFPIRVSILNSLHTKFRLQIETESMITCMPPSQPTTPSSPTTALPTTSLKQTTQNRPSTFPYTASQRLPVGRPTSISITTNQTPTIKNDSSNEDTRDGNITLIVISVGSGFILILIIYIIFLRCKQTKDRQENEHIENASIAKEHPEVCYESVEDGCPKGTENATSIKELRGTSLDQRRTDFSENGEMIDDILYDSADKISDSSISRMKGPLDNALYTMPDKRATISREPKSTSKDRSSNSDHLYGNSVIITQHEQSRDALQQGDKYENVKMTGSGGDAEEIPLYDMPDKGLMWNTLKATPEAGQASINLA